MPQCIRAFKCTVPGTPAYLTRNPVLGGFVGQESRVGYGYTSINTTARLFTSLVWHHLSMLLTSIMVTSLGPLGLFVLTTRDAPLPFPSGLTSLSPMVIPSYSHLTFTSLLPCPLWHGPAFNEVYFLFIWRMAPCESIILLLSGPLVPLCLLLWRYVAFFL